MSGLEPSWFTRPFFSLDTSCLDYTEPDLNTMVASHCYLSRATMSSCGAKSVAEGATVLVVKFVTLLLQCSTSYHGVPAAPSNLLIPRPHTKHPGCISAYLNVFTELATPAEVTKQCFAILGSHMCMSTVCFYRLVFPFHFIINYSTRKDTPREGGTERKIL